MNKRNFLIKGIKTIATFLFPGSMRAKVQGPEAANTKVKMLTKDGKLVWVDMQDSNQRSKPPISNQELYSWINSVNHETK
jgi:hypothetical protein